MYNEQDEFTVINELVYEFKVRDAMTKKVITVHPENTLREVQVILRENRFSGVPVMDKGQLVGIVSLEDIIKALDKGYIEEKVGKWMTKNVVTIRDNVSLSQAVSEFQIHKYGRLPVMDENQKLVGIITSGDIVTHLMLELNRIAEVYAYSESKRIAEMRKTDISPSEVSIEVNVRSNDFDNAGIVSQKIKEELVSRGIDSKVTRRAAIATYEAETNIIIHSIGGKILAHIFEDKIIIYAIDWGPGIEDIEQAMQPGFSTATELVRALGFGAGMGLNNIKKCADKFEIESEPDVGTKLAIEIQFNKE